MSEECHRPHADTSQASQETRSEAAEGRAVSDSGAQIDPCGVGLTEGSAMLCNTLLPTPAAFAVLRAMLADECADHAALVDRIVAFGGQLQAWGNDAAAAELFKEVLGDAVHAPDYYALRADHAALVAAVCRCRVMPMAGGVFVAGEDWARVMEAIRE